MRRLRAEKWSQNVSCKISSVLFPGDMKSLGKKMYLHNERFVEKIRGKPQRIALRLLKHNLERLSTRCHHAQVHPLYVYCSKPHRLIRKTANPNPRLNSWRHNNTQIGHHVGRCNWELQPQNYSRNDKHTRRSCSRKVTESADIAAIIHKTV